MTHYPAKNRGNHYPCSRNQSNMPQIIPQNPGNGRNVAGQVKTLIHMKNARGEEVSIYQTQQVLNLLNGDRGDWLINGGIYQNRKGRKLK